jgi:hypothetical protein
VELYVLNSRRNILWIVIGGATCLCAFMFLIIPLRRQDNVPSATLSPMISPSPITIVSRDDRENTALVQNPIVPSIQSAIEKKQFSSLPPPDQAAREVHAKAAAGLDATIRQETRRLYEAAFQQLHLPADLQEKVISILTQQQKQLEQQAFDAAQSGSFPAPPSPEGIREQQVQQDQQLRSVLGDAAFAQFDQYRATIPDHIIVDSMNQQGANLSANQSQQLVQILTAARQQIMNPVGIRQNLSSMPPDQAMTFIQQEQVLLQQAVDERVKNLLTPEQATSLKGLLSPNNISPRPPSR